MAKAEGFKNKITKAQEDLFKALDTEKEKKKVLSDKIVQEISKQEKANVKTLNSLNKEYLEVCKNNNETIKQFSEQLEQLNTELSDIVNLENEEQIDLFAVLKEENEQAFVISRNKFRREIQDINIKIDRIDRDLKETIEERNSTYEQENANFKSKATELDRRKRFEVTKIQNNTIKEYDALQKSLLKENKKSEIKAINKKIKLIRYNGLIEEKECIYRHLAELRQFELDYAKTEYDFKCETSKIEQDYNTRIEETKFDRSMIEFNFQKNSDKNNNDVIHLFNEKDKENRLNKNNQIEIAYKKINDKTIESLNFEKAKAELEKNTCQKIYQDIEDNDTKQGNKLIELTNKELVLLNKDLSLFQKNINMTITFYVQNIINTYTHYFKNFVKKEEIFMSSLLVNIVDGAFLQGNEYKEYVIQVANIFTSFKENEEKYLNTFNEYVNNALNNILIQVEAFIQNVNQLNENINLIINSYHNEVNNVLLTAKNKGFDFVQNIQNKINQEIVIKENDNTKLFNDRMTVLTSKNNAIIEEYNTREKEVKSVELSLLDQYQIKQAELEVVKAEAIDLINNKYEKEISDYLVDYENKVKTITLKFDEENKNVEKQYKMKMGLL